MNENLKILVVDDEETILNIFRKYLESTSHYTVLTARDGLEGLEVLLFYRPFHAQTGRIGTHQENPGLR